VNKNGLMSKEDKKKLDNIQFSTDENSIWFNGKKYGAYKLNYKLYELSGGSLNQSDIINALDGFTQEHWDLVSEGGIGYMVSPIASTTLCSLRAWVDSSYKYLSIVMYAPAGNRALGLTYDSSSRTYEGAVLFDKEFVGIDEIVNNLTSTASNNPLSANMGKKLNDEKLAKTDVVNSLSDSSTNKALSAAQGKALNDRLNSNAIGFIFSGTQNSTDNDTIKGFMGNLDGTTLYNRLRSGATIVDASSENWVITLKEINAAKVVFVGLKFQSFNVYTKTITVIISGGTYTNMTIVSTNRYVPNVVNNLTSSDTINALSAAQGKVLNNKITETNSEIEKINNKISTMENMLAYGVEWNINIADPHITRIGNMSLHKTLPIQSQLKGCIA